MPDAGNAAEASLSLLITGASSQIGGCLIARILAANGTVIACSRKPQRGGKSGIRWIQLDLERPLPEGLPPDPHDLIHLAPLPLLPARVEELAGRGIRRLIAIGSTSRYSKVDSGHPGEREVARRLASAESVLADRCEAAGVVWTIFRPTLIYGVGQDQNVSAIARFVSRYRFYPLAGEGSGLRQPVHADDLAHACLLALHNPRTHGKAYNLAGGEVLSYRDMVSRVFASVGLPPRFIRLPPRLLRATLRLAAWLPRLQYLTPDMANRMNLDLCFDFSPAADDFGYSPRPFDPPRITRGHPGRAELQI